MITTGWDSVGSETWYDWEPDLTKDLVLVQLGLVLAHQ